MHIFVKGKAIKFGRILEFHPINLFVDQVSPTVAAARILKSWKAGEI